MPQVKRKRRGGRQFQLRKLKALLHKGYSGDLVSFVPNFPVTRENTQESAKRLKPVVIKSETITWKVRVVQPDDTRVTQRLPPQRYYPGDPRKEKGLQTRAEILKAAFGAQSPDNCITID